MPFRLCYCGRTTPCALHPRALRHKTRRTPPPRGSTWRRIRQVVLYRDGHRCQRCATPDTPGNRLHVHHVVARREGGTDTLSNLVTLCALCHPQVERDSPATCLPGRLAEGRLATRLAKRGAMEESVERARGAEVRAGKSGAHSPGEGPRSSDCRPREGRPAP